MAKYGYAGLNRLQVAVTSTHWLILPNTVSIFIVVTAMILARQQRLFQSWLYNSYTAIPDTVSTIDTGINAVTGPWSYKVNFYAANNQPMIDTIGSSASALPPFF